VTRSAGSTRRRHGSIVPYELLRATTGMRIRPLAGCVLLALLGLLALARPAEAGRGTDPLAKPADPEALRHLERGDAHFRIQEFQQAIDEYRDGARLEAAPRFLYNIAQAYRQLGDYEKALWYFDQWIKTGKPPEEMRKAVEDVMAKMRDDLAKAAKNQPPTEPASDVGPRDSDETDANLDGDRRGGTTDNRSSSDRASIAIRSDLPSAGRDPWYADTVGWSLAGGGLLLAGVGAGFLMNASSLDDEAGRPQTPEADREDLRSKAEARAIVGAVLLSAGGVAGAGGVIKLISTPATPSGSSRELALRFGSGWVGLEGKY
jgi:tetratricopeptide (TPR) repeat protein